MAARILVLIAHPNLRESRVNRAMTVAISGLPNVTLRLLYDLYPGFTIDVRTEQAECESHDVIVMQHPFYWYSCPALLKEWIDRVLQRGWAYGAGRFALKGKLLMCALSAGALPDAYAHAGKNRFTILELLAPFDQMAHLCHMRFLPPFMFYNARQASDDDIAAHAARYRALISTMQSLGADPREAQPALHLR